MRSWGWIPGSPCATQDGRIVDLDMEEALQMKKSFPMERYQILEALTLSGSHRR